MLYVSKLEIFNFLIFYKVPLSEGAPWRYRSANMTPYECHRKSMLPPHAGTQNIQPASMLIYLVSLTLI